MRFARSLDIPTGSAAQNSHYGLALMSNSLASGGQVVAVVGTASTGAGLA